MGTNRELSKIGLELLEMQWDDFDDFLKKFDSTVNHDNYAIRATMFNSYAEMGYSLKSGLIDVKTICDMLEGGYAVIQMWNKFEPIFLKQREIYGDPKRYSMFEYLVNELRKERVRQGMDSGLINYDGCWKE